MGKMLDPIQKIFLNTLQCVIMGKPLDFSLYASLTTEEWMRMYRMAVQQGVVAILFEGIQQLSKETAPPLKLLMQWSAHTFSIEDKQNEMGRVAADFAQLMCEHGIKTMVLKGKAFSTYYPYPNHRECGDLDCFLMGRYADGDNIAAEHGAKVEGSGYKHSHIVYKGLTIENHQYLTSFDNTKRGVYTERMLQDVIAKGGNQIDNTSLWNPSCEFNALYLVEHALRHFLKEGIVVRHLLDWAYFLKVEQEQVNWSLVYTEMDKCHLRKFADMLTYLCVIYLGVEITNPAITYTLEKPMAEIVLYDILNEEHVVTKESFVKKMKRVFCRFQRMWRFRCLANENYLTLIWTNIAFSSYLNTKVKL